jgi:pantoate--beta-alanine ligase
LTAFKLNCNLKIFNKREDIHYHLNDLRSAGKSIGFVPTMGALHAGHLSLIEAARNKTDVVVCSIFVNPTQFNDKKDLENYPRTLDEDLQKLREFKCDILFLPEVEEMYNSSEIWKISLGDLDKVLEGKIRPGHYQGVTQIVNKLFDTLKPDFAFFGQKDYQQVMVISDMVRKLNIDVKIVVCPIIRELDGLAMSSRNVYLSPEERIQSLALYHALILAQNLFETQSIVETKKRVRSFLDSCPGIGTEYFEIFNARTFKPLNSKNAETTIALIAARIGKIRIIDNMYLNKGNSQ